VIVEDTEVYSDDYRNASVVLENSMQQQRFDHLDGLGPQEVQIGMLDLIKRPRFLMGGLSASLAYFLYGFIEPILAFRVKDFSLT
jgi:hypothetical protein